MNNQGDKREFFGKGKQEIRGIVWDWENFETTEGFPVSDNLLDWVIGQDRVIEEVKLALDEWLYKLKYLQKKKWYKPWLDPQAEKKPFSKILTPGPYLLLLGDPGTGKSLIGRAMAEYLTKLYAEHKIKRFDVLCWPNKLLPSNPKISVHPAGKGKDLLKQRTQKIARRSWWKTWGIRILMFLLGALGLAFLGIALMDIMTFAPLIGLANALLRDAIVLSIGASIIFCAFFIWQLTRLLGGNLLGGTDIGGALRSEAPKLLVDNSSKTVPFIDATGHTSAQLFGCLDQDTKILTTSGFKTYNELERGMLVYTLNPITEELEVQPIEQVFVYDYNGPLYTLKSRKGINFGLTPNHNCIFRPRYDYKPKPLKFAKLETLLKQNRFYFPTYPKAYHGKPTNLSEDMFRLIGWYISEGYLHPKRKYVCISQLRHRKELLDLLNRMKLPYHVNGDSINIVSKDLYEFFKQFGTSSSDKKIPFFILEAEQEKLKCLFETMMLGDGSRNQYYTASQRLRDDFAQLLLRLGFAINIREDNRNPKRWNTTYCISFSKRAGCVQSKNVVKTEYHGKVWCIQVRNHNFLVLKDGRTFFSGNSIAWDPYQTGGLGTPEHQRVVAGDVHRASMGILYIDEIKNLSPFDVVTLLSVMEDGCLPVTIRSQWHGADTAAMAVATEPIPALFFLLAAGNFDSLGQIHPALMDRLVGYGRVVRMNNDMPNTVENRRKYVQFIAQEIKRFHLPPFSREACIELVEEARRRSNKRDALTCRFRPLIAVIKTAGTLARNKGKEIVGVEEVKEAIDVHCKTIQRQILEHQVQEQGKLLEIKPVGIKRGTIYGLAVVTDQFSGEMTGSILRVKAQMVKKTSKKGVQGYYKVTGIAKDAKWINDSAEKVRSVILQKYGVDIAQEYFTHIDFSQAYGVDGPSAGVTMALLLCSLLEDKPIRQDVAVTGEINISAENEIEITAVGGVHEKIKAAEAWGFKKVVIPMKNFEQSIKESDYKIEVVGAGTLDDYLKEVLAEGKKGVTENDSRQ